MQRTKNKLYKKLFICTAGSAWVAGLLIAGSDNPYMPWVNGLGLILFFCSSVLIGRHFRSSRYSADSAGPARYSQKKVSPSYASEKKLQRIHMPVVPVGKCRNLQWN